MFKFQSREVDDSTRIARRAEKLCEAKEGQGKVEALILVELAN